VVGFPKLEEELNPPEDTYILPDVEENYCLPL
jgi:hypothetical protein